MTCFFYTDPLAAAWMAKHFGMKFGVKHNGVVHWNCIGQINQPFEPLQRPEDILDPIAETVPLYVHPDSLHLLEPRGCDLIQYVICGGPVIHFGVFGGLENSGHGEKDLIKLLSSTQTDIGESTGFFALKSDCKIIQRNGIPFMWPESEDA